MFWQSILLAAALVGAAVASDDSPIECKTPDVHACGVADANAIVDKVNEHADVLFFATHNGGLNFSSGNCTLSCSAYPPGDQSGGEQATGTAIANGVKNILNACQQNGFVENGRGAAEGNANFDLVLSSS